VVDDERTRYVRRLRFSRHKIRQRMQRANVACSAALQSEVAAYCDPVTASRGCVEGAGSPVRMYVGWLGSDGCAEAQAMIRRQN